MKLFIRYTYNNGTTWIDDSTIFDGYSGAADIATFKNDLISTNLSSLTAAEQSTLKILDAAPVESGSGAPYTLPNSVLHVDPLIGATPISVRDTAGNTSPLKLGTTKIEIAAPSSTGSDATPALDITKTLNTTGSPDIICISVTNTASGAATNLINFKISGTSVLKLGKNNFLDFFAAGGLSFGGNSDKGIFWSSGDSSTTIYSQFTAHNFRVYNGSTYAKRVFINNTGLYVGTGTIKASAATEIESTTQGFLLPRMTTAQRDAISAPATGLMIYDTTSNQISVYTGASWRYLQLV